MSCAWCAFWITAYSWLHVDKWQTGNKYQFPFYSKPGTLLFVYLVCWGRNSKKLSESEPFPPFACCVASSLDGSHTCLSVTSVICWLSIWAFWRGEQRGKGYEHFGMVLGGVVFFCFFICWDIFSEHFFFIHSIKENSHLALDIY